MMSSTTYQQRRGEIETYFDRTAMAAWAKLTSTAKVSGIRATVRAGRDNMRNTLLSWLPADMHGLRLLDAGCGTGALALEAAARGAEVVAIDLSPQLVALAAERAAALPHAANITFRSGDMLDPALGYFDYVVLMDSIIHYEAEDAITALSQLCARTRRAILFTVAPRTPILGTMLSIGKLLPRGNRSPSIVPQNTGKLRSKIAGHTGFAGFTPVRAHRIKSGFYFSEAMEVKKC
jgi:magnesium-protoporphyrin O-methyltransferase